MQELCRAGGDGDSFTPVHKWKISVRRSLVAQRLVAEPMFFRPDLLKRSLAR